MKHAERMVKPEREGTRACPGCGYDLRGIAFIEKKARCPECGRDLVMVSAGDVFEPPVGRGLLHVSIAPMVSPVVMAIAVYFEVPWALVLGVSMLVIAMMASILAFCVHATRVNLPPRSMYVVRLFLLGFVVNVVSVVACVIVFGMGAARSM